MDLEMIIGLVVSLFFFVLIWYFVRTLAKAIVALSRMQENHSELMETLEEMKAAISRLETRKAEE